MKNKLLFIVLLLFAILLSCEQEKELQIENETTPLLSREIYSDELYLEYTYNEANLLKERKTKWSYVRYFYNDNNQLISYDFYQDPRVYSSTWVIADAALHRIDWVTPENTEISSRGVYSYSNDKLMDVTVTRLPEGSTTYTTFEYDENGRIGKETFYSEGQPFGFIEYSYDNKGNLILKTKKYFVNGNPVLNTTEEYEYDDKNNPYKAFSRLLRPGEYTNKNNIVKKTLTLFFDGPGIDTVQVTESTYEYNSQDYPLKKDNIVQYEYDAGGVQPQ